MFVTGCGQPLDEPTPETVKALMPLPCVAGIAMWEATSLCGENFELFQKTWRVLLQKMITDLQLRLASAKITELQTQRLLQEAEMFADEREYDYDQIDFNPGADSVPPRYAADCTDCKHPNVRDCSRCHIVN